jgi:hypothetical protein
MIACTEEEEGEARALKEVDSNRDRDTPAWETGDVKMRRRRVSSKEVEKKTRRSFSAEVEATSAETTLLMLTLSATA